MRRVIVRHQIKTSKREAHCLTDNEVDFMLQFVEQFNTLLVVLLTLCYGYQLFYLVYGAWNRRKTGYGSAKTLHRYAAVICARNEAEVIGELIQSLREQNYPAHLLDIYVVADNCTDATARVARKAGAIVYSRFDRTQVGKGYALNYLFEKLRSERSDLGYEGFFVFDADNLVDPNFVAEMNKVFDTGRYQAITCYRNSKNFGSNWISAGYSLWFLREARFLNFPRMLLGTNCAISGTGFLVSAQAIRENGGWPYHLLTEDIEFSVNCALKGQRIGYCEKAVIYDEQPTRFRQSWDQRLRWSKGFYQVDLKYGGALLQGCFSKGSRKFSCYDMLMTVAPGMLLTLVTIAFNGIVALACLTQPSYITAQVLNVTLEFIGSAVIQFYLGLLLYGGATVVCEWRQIDASAGQKIRYLFTFPLFMFTYIPISLAALIRKVEWKPIQHTSRKVLRGSL